MALRSPFNPGNPPDNHVLPGCWVESIVLLYFDRICADLNDAHRIGSALNRQETEESQRVFVLTPGHATFCGRIVDAQKYVEMWDAEYHETLEVYFIREMKKKNISSLDYLWGVDKGTNIPAHAGEMRFWVDDEGIVQRRLFKAKARLSDNLFEANPTLEKSVLAVLENIANSFTEGPTSTAERSFLQGLRALGNAPYTWRSNARRLLHSIPDEVYDVIESGGLPAAQKKRNAIFKLEAVIGEPK